MARSWEGRVCRSKGVLVPGCWISLEDCAGGLPVVPQTLGSLVRMDKPLGKRQNEKNGEVLLGDMVWDLFYGVV